MKTNNVKNKVLSLLVLTGMALAVSSCQIDQEPEMEGPTQVAAKQSMGPTDITARINNVGKDGKEVFDITEVQPNPPGGMEGWKDYLASNLSYPSQARQMGIEGTVIVKFMVNSDGSISNTEIIRGIGGGTDEEAIRVVENSPKWSPAQQRDQVVNSWMRLPVRFQLNQGEKAPVALN